MKTFKSVGAVYRHCRTSHLVCIYPSRYKKCAKYEQGLLFAGVFSFMMIYVLEVFSQSTFGEMAVDRCRLGYDKIARINGDCDTCMT